MTDKKTFPGAMNAEQQRELEKSRKLAAERAEAKRIIAEQKKKEEQKRADLIKRFAPSISGAKLLKVFGLTVVGNYCIGATDRKVMDYYLDTSYGTEVSVLTGPKLSEAVREAYDPYFHGGSRHTDAIYFSKAYRNNETNDRWQRHMMLLGIEAFIFACVLIGFACKKQVVVDDIDIMLEIEKRATWRNISRATLNRMVNVAPEIVKHMSKEDSVYFEMLMNGDLDCEQNPQVFAIAKSVLAGHLASHPEDMQRVLAVFDEASLPQSLVAEYKQNVR